MSWDIQKASVYEKWKPYWFRTHPNDVAEYSWNYLFTGGKQIRAKLFCDLWSYLSGNINDTIDTRLYNTYNDNTNISYSVAELAFAIECIHVASIVLDDTLIRRGCHMTLSTRCTGAQLVCVAIHRDSTVRLRLSKGSL